MPGLYARLECMEHREGFKLVYETLEDHLTDTAVVACILAKRLGYDPRAASLAAALHDIGKVLHNMLQRHVVERVEKEGCSRAWRLSFTYHEILSAAVYGYYMWFEGKAVVEDRVVARAILLHHQGLRGLETRVYLDGLAWISSRVAQMQRGEREELIETMSGVLEKVASRLVNCKMHETLTRCCVVCKSEVSITADIARRVSKTIRSVGIEAILENASTLLGEWIKVPEYATREARGVSGILMLADNAVAREHAGQESQTRLYPEEARWLERRTVGLLCSR